MIRMFCQNRKLSHLLWVFFNDEGAGVTDQASQAGGHRLLLQHQQPLHPPAFLVTCKELGKQVKLLTFSDKKKWQIKDQPELCPNYYTAKWFRFLPNFLLKTSGKCNNKALFGAFVIQPWFYWNFAQRPWVRAIILSSKTCKAFAGAFSIQTPIVPHFLPDSPQANSSQPISTHPKSAGIAANQIQRF